MAKIDQDVNKVLKLDEGKTLTELDYAARNRTILLYTMLYVKKLVGVSKAICFFLVVITFVLVVWSLSTSTFHITGTITPR